MKKSLVIIFGLISFISLYTQERIIEKVIEYSDPDFSIEIFNDDSPIIRAVKEKNIAELQKLVVKDSSSINDTDYDNKTPLMWATYIGWQKGCIYLIDKGADLFCETKKGENLWHFLLLGYSNENEGMELFEYLQKNNLTIKNISIKNFWRIHTDRKSRKTLRTFIKYVVNIKRPRLFILFLFKKVSDAFLFILPYLGKVFFWTIISIGSVLVGVAGMAVAITYAFGEMFTFFVIDDASFEKRYYRKKFFS